MDQTQFAQTIKAKYPQYAAIDDATLTQKVIAKYPQYASKVNLTAQQATSATLSPAQAPQETPSVGGFIGNAVTSTGNLIGGLANAVMHPIDTITNVAKLGAGVVEKGIGAVDKATGGQGINNQDTQSVDNVVSYFKQRYGGNNASEIAHNIAHTAYTDPAAVALDLSTLLDGIGAGVGAVGRASDIAKATELAKGTDFVSTASGMAAANTPEAINALRTPGAITNTANTIGKVADTINPINQLGRAAGAVANGVGRVAGEALGVSTGAGYGSIKEGLNAVQEGGDASKSFIDALKGNTSPEELVNQAKGALGDIIQKRRSDYQTQLEKIAGDTKTYDIVPIADELENQMTKYNVGVTVDGNLDFSRSKFRFNKPIQNDIQTIYDEMKDYGTKAGDTTAIGIDNLKQAFGDLYTPSSQGRAFIQAIKSKTRDILSSVPGYDKLTSDYENSTGVINDIQKGLSLGDKAAVETSFKKLTSALRQNNEFRQQIVKELDDATNGQLLPKIAGQQLSSFAPKGLGKFADQIGFGAGVLHGFSLPLFFSLLSTSPRIAGELIKYLGLTQNQTSTLFKWLSTKVPPDALKVVIDVNNNINDSQKSD